MVTRLTQHFSHQVQRLLTWLKGFEETGNIGIDSVTLNTRNALHEYGII